MRKSFRLFSLVAGLCFVSGCGKEQSASSTTNVADTKATGNPVTAPVDYLGAIGNAKQSSDRTLSTAGLNQAVQMFYAQEGRYPKTLNELVGPNYLPKLPQPPSGMKFDYNPQTGQVKTVPQ